jgi:extracellular factor (EF) 3-hydroxypalmitic acid methyl ester biosynthesis protein
MITGTEKATYCENDWSVSFRVDSGQVCSAVLQRIDPESCVFELYGDSLMLQASEVLQDLKVVMKNRTVFDGNATLTSVIKSGAGFTCNAILSGEWRTLDPGELPGDAFLTQWQAHSRLEKRFKLAVADLHCFLLELRLWLDQEELTLSIHHPDDAALEQHHLLEAILPRVSPVLDGLFERFEEACGDILPDTETEHRVYLRRILHPLLMSCPFMHRIFAKPLGYAGDYEMMNMIWRNGFEGESMFAMLLNRYIVNQAPGVSVRNRVDYMTRVLAEEATRAASQYGSARVLSIGYGPAREVQNFLAHPASNQTEFVLLDFNDETLRHTRGRIETLSEGSARARSVEYVKKSAHYLLREDAQVSSRSGEGYDLIYSSGLYDYLNDRMCIALNTQLFGLLRPGGMLVVTNFTPSNPIRGVMEFMFEWFLIHRDAPQMAGISPTNADPDDCRVYVEDTACNAFLQARKPVG